MSITWTGYTHLTAGAQVATVAGLVGSWALARPNDEVLVLVADEIFHDGYLEQLTKDSQVAWSNWCPEGAAAKVKVFSDGGRVRVCTESEAAAWHLRGHHPIAVILDGFQPDTQLSAELVEAVRWDVDIEPRFVHIDTGGFTYEPAPPHDDQFELYAQAAADLHEAAAAMTRSDHRHRVRSSGGVVWCEWAPPALALSKAMVAMMRAALEAYERAQAKHDRFDEGVAGKRCAGVLRAALESEAG